MYFCMDRRGTSTTTTNCLELMTSTIQITDNAFTIVASTTVTTHVTVFFASSSFCFFYYSSSSSFSTATMLLRPLPPLLWDNNAKARAKPCLYKLLRPKPMQILSLFDHQTFYPNTKERAKDICLRYYKHYI